MNSKPKKIIINTVLIAFILLLAMFMSLVTLQIRAGKEAEAAVEDLAFTVEAGIYDDDTGIWIPYYDGDVSPYRISFRFEFTGVSPNPSITEFRYVEGTNYQQVATSNNWKGDGEGNAFLKPVNMMTNNMLIWTFPRTETYDMYVKFKATAATTSGGTGEPIIEEYILSNVFHIVYNNTVMESDIQINTVNATFQQGTVWKPYNTVLGHPENIWVSTKIRFEIISKNIALGGTIKEKFYYSIDGRDVNDSNKEWHPATENICILEQNMNGPVQFRVTDQSGMYKYHYVTDTNGLSINVKMDIVTPEFEVRATSTKIENGEYVTYEYNSNLWSYNEIIYSITPTAKGQSPISYEYRISGGPWSTLTKNTGSEIEYYTLPLSVTTNGIEFRAVSLALKSYTAPGSYHAYIDKVQPVVSITARDERNTEIKSFGTLEGQGYRVGYASDILNFVIYNKTPQGNIIINNSELIYRYKYTYIDSNGNQKETAYASMSRNTDNQGYTYYTFSDGVFDSNPIKNRKYTFRLESRSGLYDERSFTATILYSDFTISMDLVSRIENEKGWANAPIAVYINAPIMDKYIFAYGISGTGYENFEKRFVWAADGSGDGDEIVKDVSADFAGIIEGEPGYLPPGMAKFRIYLSTSVERRYFKIYAYNAAEVKSSNEANTPEIRLDMVTPNVKLDAYIQHSEILLNSGEWANGNIELILDSRALPSSQISLSGIDCELMIDYNIPDKFISSQLDNDGLPIGKFIYLMEIPEGQYVYTKKLIFRLTSGSGLQNFVEFEVRIDKSDIVLNKVKDTTNSVDVLVFNPNNPVFTAQTQAVCKDVFLNFTSNHGDHFSYWYSIDGGAFIKGYGNNLTVSIPLNSTGVMQVQFYLESNALDFQGNKKKTNTFTVSIPYNCLSINITVAIQPISQGYEMDSNNWRNGPLSFLINLPAGESYSDYTYGMIILGNRTPEQFYAEKGLLQANQKSDIYAYCTPVNLIEGVFDFWGVDEYGTPRFHDPLNPPNPSQYTRNCFYTGNIMIFAFNQAKYSSNAVPVYSNEVRVDNSVPDVTDLIESLNGEIDGTNVYNNETIVLRHPNYQNRAAVEYYIHLSTPSALPTSNNLNGWQKMRRGSQDSGIEFINIEFDPTDNDGITYYLYAINTLNSGSSLDIGEMYTFLVDSEVPIFEVKFPEGEGSNTVTDINGESYNVFTFTWTEQINIEFSHTSETSVYYWYSLDNKKTWIKWNELASTQKSTIFTYSEDINSTMFFKLTNLAGSEIVHIRPAVVRIDTRRPDFVLEAYVGGNPYSGGGYGSIPISGGTTGLSLDDTSGQWASSTVTIVIKIDEALRNTSPIQYQYLVKTKNYETQYVQTPSNVVINNRITFTTDRMDSFGQNNDAIIVVQARCPANGKVYTQAIRIKVDKVVPEFNVNGEVYVSGTSETKPLYSGDWTNMEEVRLSIEKKHNVDVSNVRIVYFRDGSSLENQWPTVGSSYGYVTSTRSETIRVVARNESGLVFERIFEINIDTVPPMIESGIIVPSVTDTPNTYYIDQPIYFREENLKSAQYITRKGDTIGFPLSQGHIIATNSVDNSDNSRGYVKIIIEDLAGNKAELEFYMIPFQLNINNLTLSQQDLDTVDRYEEDLKNARGIDNSRRAYFENLIVRLRDRENTLRQEISGFQSYLAGLSQKASYELKSDYRQMSEYLNTYNNYAYYKQEWIQQAIIEGEYYAYFQKLQEEFAKLDKEMARVRQVEENTKKLPAINVVKVTDYNNILQVYDSYDDLSPDQKSVYATTLFNKLITIKRKCENMLLQDEESGIKIDGRLAPGARIEVTNYPNTVELFNNAQETILNTVSSDKPRTIISINKVSIKGAASQTSTGDILVTLPIPEDFYNYVRFAVYKLSPDGTVTEVRGVEIQGDGKSVVFAADSLDTYVLATKANIAVRETNDNIYGTIGDIEIDIQMLQYISFATIGIFVILIVVIILAGLRRRRFLNHYNKAHKSSIYKKGVQDVPKGNKPPREHPFKDNERVKTPDKPIIKD